MKVPSVAALIIGDEILTGKVVDANTPYLARRLHELGADLKTVRILRDEVEEIARAVRETSPEHDFVLTSGGVGPTHDDVTMAAVARAFDCKVIRHSYLENLLSHHFGGEELTAARGRLAEIPDGADLLIRPGAGFPQVVMRNVYIFPGVPGLLQEKFEQVATLFKGVPWTCRAIQLEGDETEAAPTLNRAVRLHPGVRFGSYPSPAPGSTPEAPSWTIRITLESREAGVIEAAETFLLANFPASLNPRREG